MKNNENVFCSTCGAIKKKGQSYCGYCGSEFPVIPKEKKSVFSVLGTLSLIAGILAFVMLSMGLFFKCYAWSVFAIITGIIGLFSKKHRKIFPIIGMCIGVYAIFVNAFWFLLAVIFSF